jgi:hypothetical protein
MKAKRGFYFISIALAILGIALLGAGAPSHHAAIAEEIDEDISETEYPPSFDVKVPVILDGVRYEPEGFNRIQRELYPKRAYLIATIDNQNGDFLAFTSVEKYNEYATKVGLPPYSGPPKNEQKLQYVTVGNRVYVFAAGDSNAHPQIERVTKKEGLSDSNAGPCLTCGTPDDFWSDNWDKTYCVGPRQLSVAPDTHIRDLSESPGNWSDIISSIQVASDYDVWVEALWEDINFEGAGFLGSHGTNYPNLGEYGWDERASSLETLVYERG